MRPLTVSNLVVLLAGQALALVVGCASTYGVWLWLVAAHPFK
jgi:hypothetical protein